MTEKPIVDTLDTQIAKAREEMAPESITAINAVSWRLILSGINKNYNPDQLYNLETETELLLCGLITPEAYPKELESRMRLHKAEVETLINEIDKLIFKKIQEELEKRLAEKPKDTPMVRKSFSPDPLFVSLPMLTQEAIALSGWKDSVYEIAKKYNLNIEKTGELQNVVVQTLTNVIHTDKFESEIKSKFNLPDDKNKEMIAELNEKIFKKIQELMQNNANKIGKAPLPPYAKVITNDQLLITNDGLKKIREIPKPVKIITNDQLPITNDIKEKIPEIDPYKEHGIEIIINEQLPITNEVIKKEEIPLQKEPLVKNEPIPTIIEPKKTNEEIIKAFETKKPLVNMMTEKLLGKTVNSATVSDHTIPKMSSQHDPYHEEV